jgi:hypothetical protein
LADHTIVYQALQIGKVSTLRPGLDDVQGHAIQTDDHDFFGFFHLTSF